MLQVFFSFETYTLKCNANAGLIVNNVLLFKVKGVCGGPVAMVEGTS